MKNKYFLIGCVLVSVVLSYLSFPNCFNFFGYWPLAWIALVPFFWVLGQSSLRERIILGSIFSILFFGILVYWTAPVSLLIYIIFVLMLSLAPILFAVLFPCPTQNRWIGLIYCPALWVATEFLRTMVMGGFSWTLGHSQSFHVNAIQLAGWTGAYGISFVLVLFNYCLFCILKEEGHWVRYTIVAIGTVSLVLLYGYDATTKNITQEFPSRLYEACLIQPNITTQEKSEDDHIDQIIEKYIHLTNQCLDSYQPDLVIWPETAIPDDFIKDPTMRGRISAIATEIKTHLLLGAALLENDHDYNSAVLLNGRGAVLDIYNKQNLIPFREYLPFQEVFGFLKSLFHVEIYDFYPGRALGVFTIRKKDVLKNYVENKFGVVLCSEGAYPTLFRKLVWQGSGFVVVMLNDAWFKSPEALIMHTQNEILRAVENRIPIVRAANSGWSCAIDPYGRVKSLGPGISSLNTTGFYLSHIFPNNQPTFYTENGDIFSYLCIVFVIMIFVIIEVLSIKQNFQSSQKRP